ncbi:MAG: restriction endonuclease subunit R, partial [Bacteroidales bacterium]|nr:restriction endonuclease subunit R [Bacteroidales bacterium]
AETEYLSLDTPVSKKKIILLVQIGKEGWDCKSLTGVILSQKGDCPTNMVLQTSCRCLRQVDRGQHETAIIWLNEFNARTLNKQLQDQQNISLEDFSNKKGDAKIIELERHSRMEYLKLPPIDFFQLKVDYLTQIEQKNIDIEESIGSINVEDYKVINVITTQNFKGEEIEKEIEKVTEDEITTFSQWISLIAKESFGFISVQDLRKYEYVLSKLFDKIVVRKEDHCFLIKSFKHEQLRSQIRLSFAPKRYFETKEEIVPQKASLLKIDSFTPQVKTATPEKYYPNQDEVRKIIDLDDNKITPDDEKTRKAIEELELLGQYEMIEALKNKTKDVPEREKTYHYLPYRFDSGFEERFMKILTLKDFNKKGLEVYFNGDGSLTEFRIRCYKKQGKQWKYIGIYTPDFLIIKRRNGKIHQSVIVETKGQLYAQDQSFIDRRNFMQGYFIEQNNKQFGYNRFEYLYLEDTKNENKLIDSIVTTINHFFENQ